LLSRMITEHWLWGYNGKWARLSHYFPVRQHHHANLFHLNWHDFLDYLCIYICVCVNFQGPTRNLHDRKISVT
jgi:hypothetical protein